MGGLGSGTRFSDREILQDCLSISTGQLREWGWLARGSGLAWIITGTRGYLMELREDAGGKRLEVNPGSPGGPGGNDCGQSISLVGAPLPFGGFR